MSEPRRLLAFAIAALTIAAFAVLSPAASFAAGDDDVLEYAFPALKREQLFTYLAAVRDAKLSVKLTIDNGRGAGQTASVSIVEAPNGTVLEIRSEFSKEPGDEAAILRSFAVVPSNPVKMLGGLITFDRLALDGAGKPTLSISIAGTQAKMSIDRIFRDPAGNVVIETDGKGILGLFARDLRITPSGQLEYRSLGFLWLNCPWLGAGWKDDFPELGKINLGTTIPVPHWPPWATDILDWFPVAGQLIAGNGSSATPSTPAPSGTPPTGTPPAGTPASGRNAIDLPDIPVRRLDLRYLAKIDDTTIKDASFAPAGLHFGAHQFDLEAHGKFDGRTYRDDPSARNAFSTSLALSGDIATPSGGASLEKVALQISGTHKAVIPFQSLDRLELECGISVTGSSTISAMKASLAGAGVSLPGKLRSKMTIGGSIVVRPETRDPDKLLALRFDRKDNTFRIQIEGPLVASAPKLDLGQGWTASAPRLELAGLSGQRDLVELRGKGGVERGVIAMDTQLLVSARVNGDASKLALAQAGSERFGAQLAAGTELAFDTKALIGIPKSAIDKLVEGTGSVQTLLDAFDVNGTTEASAKGGLRAVKLDIPEAQVEVPGGLDFTGSLGTRLALDESPLRRLVLKGEGAIRDAGARVMLALPKAPRIEAEVAEGTKFALDTGEMLRRSAKSAMFATAGYGDKKRSAVFTTQLAVSRARIADGGSVLQMSGPSAIDLRAGIAFLLDPTALFPGAKSVVLPAPIDGDVDLKATLSAHAKLTTAVNGSADTSVSGPARVALKSKLALLIAGATGGEDGKLITTVPLDPLGKLLVRSARVEVIAGED